MRKLTIALALSLALLMSVIAVPQTASAWSTGVSYSGSMMSESQSDFTVKVKNTNAQTLVVTKVAVKFNWPASPQTFEIFSGSINIGSQQTMDFKGKIDVPDVTAKSYSITILVTGRLSSEIFPATNDYTGSVTVGQNPLGFLDAQALTAILVLVVMIVIVVIISVVWTRSRHRQGFNTWDPIWAKPSWTNCRHCGQRMPINGGYCPHCGKQQLP